MVEHWASAAKRALEESARLKEINQRRSLGGRPEEWEVAPPIRYIRPAEREAPGFIDHTGFRFGRLTVWGRSLKETGNAFGGGLWICRCDCGRFVARRHKTILRAAPENACSRCQEQDRLGANDAKA